MRQFFSGFMRRLALVLFVATVMMGSMLLARGEAKLIPLLAFGYAVALVFVWDMAMRLWRLTAVPGRAKRQMMRGLAFRLLVLFLLFSVAARISEHAFLVAALGFLVCYGLAFSVLAYMNLAKR